MMDYEQEYKKAFEAAKGLHEAGNALTKKQMEIVFPKLAESEDERIRKFLLLLAERCNENSIDFMGEIKKKDVIAYLEKQKEQKPAEWSEEDRDRVAQYLHDRDGGMLWSKATEITSDILDMLRPRSSWKPSEDEERLINTSISFLKDFADKGYENAVECIDWLKSIRPVGKESLQPHWKPNEEQMRALRLARSFVVDDFGETTTVSETLKELEEQLKKL